MKQKYLKTRLFYQNTTLRLTDCIENKSEGNFHDQDFKTVNDYNDRQTIQNLKQRSLSKISYTSKLVLNIISNILNFMRFMLYNQYIETPAMKFE